MSCYILLPMNMSVIEIFKLGRRYMELWPNKAELNQVITNPMANIPGVSKSNIELDQTNLNPQLRYIWNTYEQLTY